MSRRSESKAIETQSKTMHCIAGSAFVESATRVARLKIRAVNSREMQYSASKESASQINAVSPSRWVNRVEGLKRTARNWGVTNFTEPHRSAKNGINRKLVARQVNAASIFTEGAVRVERLV